VLSIYRRYGDIMMSITKEIIKFVRNALEGRGVTQEVRMVEIHIKEFIEHLKNIGLGGWAGEIWPILFDMRKIGRLLWYYDHDKKRVIVLDPSEASEKY